MEAGQAKAPCAEARLRDALLELLRAKTLGGITVKEVCEGAGVSRQTFYAHYRDLYDLLSDCWKQVAVADDEGYGYTGAVDEDAPIVYKSVLHSLEFLKENPNFAHAVCIDLAESPYMSRFYEADTAVLAGYIENHRPDSGASPLAREWTAPLDCAEYALAGYYKLIRKWVLDGMKREPSDLARELTFLNFFMCSAPAREAFPSLCA